MSQLKRLFQLASIAIPTGLGFIPTSAYAVTLSILGNTIINRPSIKEGQFTFSRDIPAFSLRILRGTLTAKQGRLTDSFGTAVNGTVLNLTGLEVRNNGANIVNLANFITFNNGFMFPYGPGRAKAYQVLSGNFIQGSQSSNSLSFTATVNGITIDTLTSRIGATPQFIFADNNQPFPKILTGLGDVAQTVEGQLTPLTLKSGNTLNLTNSACVLITTDTSVDLNQAQVEDICDRVAAPEPSSVLGILALSALGATSLLTRKQKSLQQNK